MGISPTNIPESCGFQGSETEIRESNLYASKSIRKGSWTHQWPALTTTTAAEQLADYKDL